MGQFPGVDSGRRTFAAGSRGGAAVGGGRYADLRYLAQGSAARVYRATDLEAGVEVAIKIGAARGPAAVEHPLGAAPSPVAHPNIVGIRDRFFEGSRLVTVMELVAPAIDLVAFVRGPQRVGSPLSSREIVRLVAAFAQLADGLAALHAADIVHRDIKPANVLVRAEGRVVVVDLDDAMSTEIVTAPPRRFTGTAAYAAPEVLGGRRCGTAADMYSFGVLLYEALTGLLPVDQPGWGAARFTARPGAVAAVPIRLDELTAALLRGKPQLRPSAVTVAALLRGMSRRLASPGRRAPAQHVPKVA
jgi:serine/threonine protein kinase